MTTAYRIGDMVVDPRGGYIRRPGADDLYLRFQTFQVLVYLLTHRDRVVGKEELRRAIWSDVAVTDDAFVQCVVDIRKALGDDSREQRLVKTVPRQGYRFVGPVEIVDSARQASVGPPADVPLASVASSTAEPPAPPPAQYRRHWWPGAGVLVATAVVVAAIVSTLRVGGTPLPSPDTALDPAHGVRRVIVFFFENQSGSRDFDWLRRGLAEMLITGLSRSGQIAVLSRQQLEILLERNGLDRDRTPPLGRAMELARQSGAESIILGSFVEVGGEVRFDARIHDARDGRLVASESAVSAKPNQLLTDGDLVALRVASRLGVDPRATQTREALPEVSTTSLDAYRLYLMGMEKAEARDAPEAIRLFEAARTLDPEFAMADARIGYTYAVAQSMPDEAKPHLRRAFEHPARLSEKERLYVLVWSAIADRDYAQAIARSQDLVRRYPLEVEAWRRLGAMLSAEGRPDEAHTALQRALLVDPLDSQVINTLGSVFQALGRPDDAIAMHRRYTALNPRLANAFDSLGLSYQFAGRYPEAVQAYQHALALDATFEPAAVHLGATYFQMGRSNDAVAAFRRYSAIADYDRDRARGHRSVAWVEWHRRRGPAVDAALRAARALTPDESFESFLLDLARGRPVDVAGRLALLSGAADRGRRVSKRLELYVKGQVALHEGRSSDALGLLAEAIAQPPIVWFVDPLDDGLAVALARLERLPEAIAAYREVLEKTPTSGRSRYGLARALDKAGQIEEAVREYRHFLELWKEADPDLPELIDAQTRLSALESRATRFEAVSLAGMRAPPGSTRHEPRSSSERRLRSHAVRRRARQACGPTESSGCRQRSRGKRA